MNTPIRPALLLLTIAATWAVEDGPAIHVSPRGDDGAPGSAAQPVATLVRARDLARQAGGGPRRVVVHGGRFDDAALTLESQDSGLTIEAAPGERPVLCGGVPVRGWQRDGDRFMAAPLPARSDGPWAVRLLVVDGQLARRARLPAEGTFTHETTFTVPWMSSTGGGWQRKPTHHELTTLRYRAGDLGPWLEPRNAEITVFHMWDDSCVGIAAHDVAGRELTLDPECGHPPGAFGVRTCVLWNLREGLTAPGQWYHDRVGQRIVYWPLPGQDLTQVEVLAPTRSTVLRLHGTADAPVRDVTVRGLAFTVTTVPLRAGGFAAERLPGAIALEHTERCHLDGVTIERVAGHGIDATGGSGNRITGNAIGWCGAGGIYVGGRDATISNNHVHDIGLSYPSAIGIYRGGNGNRVAHNEVHGCSYSGINYGGNGNRIEDNLVYDCMRTLHDGAAIYLFAGKRCTVRGNVVRDIVDHGGYGASAFYLDEQSEDCVIEGNLSLRVGWIGQNHMARNNVMRNNLYLTDGDAKLTFPRSSGYTMEHNIVHAGGKIIIDNPDAVGTWTGNILHSAARVIEGHRLERYRRTGPATLPAAGVLAADPLLRDAAAGDYRFAAGSPAPGLGIAELDVQQAGRQVAHEQ